MIELLEGGLEGAVGLLRFSMEAIAAFCIFVGLVTSVLAAVRHPQRTMESNFLLLRLRLGAWLALALEFQLGADILSTIVAPTFEELGKLAVIALIRTFLNYFLSRELVKEEERESQLRALKETMKPNP